MKLIKYLFNAILVPGMILNVFWHFGDVYGVDYDLRMSVFALANVFFGYWGAKALMLLATIYVMCFLLKAYKEWKQKQIELAIDLAVEKALKKYLG